MRLFTGTDPERHGLASTLILFGGLLVGFCNAERGHLFADRVDDGMPWRAIACEPAEIPPLGPLATPDPLQTTEAVMYAPPD